MTVSRWCSNSAVTEDTVTIDATPAAIMLGMLMSKEQLQELKAKAIEVQARQQKQLKTSQKLLELFPLDQVFGGKNWTGGTL